MSFQCENSKSVGSSTEIDVHFPFNDTCALIISLSYCNGFLLMAQNHNALRNGKIDDRLYA
jgi:hypothetical protein